MLQEIIIVKAGPYIVKGSIPLDHAKAILDENNFPVEWKFFNPYPLQSTYTLCRCGKTKKPPFCDGAHHSADFQGREVAEAKPFDEAMTLIKGPSISMKDLKCLCMMAKFCNINDNVWNQIAQPLDETDYQKTLQAIQHCPAGRLVPIDTLSGQILEPLHPPSISIIEEHGYVNQGAIWVKGGIPITSSSDFQYEVRNRVTLCRCGQSRNMPFCDGKHLISPPSR